MAQNCPTLNNYLAGDQCLENLAGMGEVAYIGLKSDLEGALEATDNTYKFQGEAESGEGGKPASLKSGKYLYKVELKEESQKVAGESQGKRKGFNIVGTLVFDAVNADVAKLARALNNNDIFVILPEADGDAQILYDPNKKLRIESGGLTTDTGAAAGDDRITTVNFTLGPVKYPNLFVNLVTGSNVTSWDDLCDLT